MTFHVTFLSLKFKLSREFAKKEKKNLMIKVWSESSIQQTFQIFNVRGRRGRPVAEYLIS
jgi:hypothetical protein